MAYMLQLVKVLSTEIFLAWVVFVKAIFSCLNLKPDDGFLPYNMPELFNKTGHGVTDIVIAGDEFKPVLHPEYFWEKWYMYLLCAGVEQKPLRHAWDLCQKHFKCLE